MVPFLEVVCYREPMNNQVEYDQPTPAPVPKVMAAGIAGAITTLIVWIANYMLDVQVPAEVGAGLTTIIAFIAGYYTKDKKPADAVRLIQEGGKG